ncbi:MAG: hypothetical protein U0936_18440 [Planctomycetaceae bacterium]
MKEAFEEMSVSFVSDKEPSLVLNPADCSFDLPAMEISTKRSAVLTWWLLSALCDAEDLFDTAP